MWEVFRYCVYVYDHVWLQHLSLTGSWMYLWCL